MKYMMLVCRDPSIELSPEAADEYGHSLTLARSDAERRHLTRRLREVSRNPHPTEPGRHQR